MGCALGSTPAQRERCPGVWVPPGTSFAAEPSWSCAASSASRLNVCFSALGRRGSAGHSRAFPSCPFIVSDVLERAEGQHLPECPLLITALLCHEPVAFDSGSSVCSWQNGRIGIHLPLPFIISLSSPSALTWPCSWSRWSLVLSNWTLQFYFVSIFLTLVYTMSPAGNYWDYMRVYFTVSHMQLCIWLDSQVHTGGQYFIPTVT